MLYMVFVKKSSRPPVLAHERSATGAYVYFNTWILFVASLLGPFAGVIITDNVFIRHGHLNIPDIYTVHGRYYFFHGFNLRAIAAVVIALLVLFGCTELFSGTSLA